MVGVWRRTVERREKNVYFYLFKAEFLHKAKVKRLSLQNDTWKLSFDFKKLGFIFISFHHQSGLIIQSYLLSAK